MNLHCIFRLSVRGDSFYFTCIQLIECFISLCWLFVCLFVGFLDKATVTSMIQFVMVLLPLRALFHSLPWDFLILRFFPCPLALKLG